MNKTININLAGFAFHIDENAYEKLHNYLETLRQHFNKEEGGDEILNDIEARIAELFQERLTQKEVVNMDDVGNIINIMGEPEAYGAEELEDTEAKETDLRNGKRRRVFRDRNDRMIAGVCSGIASYFDIDPLWLRIIFLLLFFTGGGVLLYIVLWIVIPEAKTTAEKLEMKGEKVTISNIEKNIKKEWDNLEGKAHDLANHPKTKQYSKQAQSAAQQITDFIINLFVGLFKALGGIFGFFAIVIGLIFFLIITTIFFAEGGIDILQFQDNRIFSYFFDDPYSTNSFVIGLLLFVLIPIVSVILLGLRLVMGTKVHRNTKLGMMALWVVSWFLIGFSIGDNEKMFKQHITYSKLSTLDNVSDTLYLQTENIDPIYLGFGKGTQVFQEDSMIVEGGVKFDITPADSGTHLKIKRTGYRALKEKESSRSLINEVNYHYKLDGEDLIFNNYFSIPKGSKWRMQEIDLTLKIPNGTVVYLDESMEEIIYDIKNVHDMWDYDMLGYYWIMEGGELRCLDCDL